MADRWQVGIHRAKSVADLGFAALQTTYAGEPYHSLGLLEGATKNELGMQGPIIT
jgi:hypothetical protein